MLTLGVNAAFHDPAACLVEDGQVIAAAEEERFTRIKHGKRPVPFSTWELPFHAIDYCLSVRGAALADVDHIAYSYDPEIRLKQRSQARELVLPLEPSVHPVAAEWESAWEPLFLASIVNAPRHLAGGVPYHLQARFRHPGGAPAYRWHFVKHHMAHAASAFLPSPFDEAAVLVIDGRGETATTTYAVGQGTHVQRLAQVDFPHSLGLLYEEVTRYLGFLHSSDEYKVMALASFGQPRYAPVFRDRIALGANGDYRIAPLRLEESFGPARLPGEPLTAHHYDIARSLQRVLEEAVLSLAGWLRRESGQNRLCMAGGVALNCVLNAKVRDLGGYDSVWVQPAAGDSGTALGAALWVDARERAGARRSYRMEHAFLGPEYEPRIIESQLRVAGWRYVRPPDLPRRVAALLAAERVVGWFQGRMEFGPRALGARSILASPRSAQMQSRLNFLKDREDFRPVAPVVLADEATEWFHPAGESPFMLFVSDIRSERADEIPAVRHVDGTARVQTLTAATHPLFHSLLREFHELTGVPMLVNTSFNTRGQPIVCTPADALACYATSPIDALAIGPFLLEKS